MNRLSDKVAIITGAARGMGKEEAKLFAKEGAKVVVADIIENEAIEVAKEIAENGGEAMACKLDVSNAKNWERMVEEISNKWGKIDILVNNAGILSRQALKRLLKNNGTR